MDVELVYLANQILISKEDVVFPVLNLLITAPFDME